MKNDTLKCIFIPHHRTGTRSIIKALSLEARLPNGALHVVHQTAKEKREQYGDHIWNTYYKFTFIRNPFDREASGYQWFKTTPRGKESNYSFKEYIEKERLDTHSQKARLVGETLDFIGDFANLQEDFNKVCDALKIDHITLDNLGEVKGSSSNYDEYDEETKGLVVEKHSEDISEYDYDLESIKEKV